MTQLPPTNPGPLYVESREAPGATAALVMGILAIVANFPIASLIVAIIGFQKAKAAKELCDANPGFYTNAGMVQAGYILCIIGIVFGSLSALCGCGYGVMLIFMIIGAAAGAGSGGSGGGF